MIISTGTKRNHIRSLPFNDEQQQNTQIKTLSNLRIEVNYLNIINDTHKELQQNCIKLVKR